MTGPRQAADRPDLTYTPAHYRIFFPKTRHIAPEKPYIPHREIRNKKIHKSKFIRIISKMIIPILAVMLSWLSVTAQDITEGTASSRSKPYVHDEPYRYFPHNQAHPINGQNSHWETRLNT